MYLIAAIKVKHQKQNVGHNIWWPDFSSQNWTQRLICTVYMDRSVVRFADEFFASSRDLQA
jgi:hypothetical protein